MARDRLLDLQLKMEQQGNGQSRDRHRRPSKGSRKRAYETNMLKSVLQQAQSIQEDISKLEDTVYDLKMRQSQFLTSSLLQTEQALTLKTTSQHARQDAERISRQLDRLGMPHVESPARTRIIENQTYALRQRLQHIIIDMNENECQFEDLLSCRVNRQRIIAGASLTDSTQSMTSSVMEPSILLLEDEELQELKQSERSLLQIEEKINLVNGMFKDLHFAVHRQQSTVETIQKKIERAQSYVETGKRHLKRLNSVKQAGRHFFKHWRKVLGGVSLSTIGLIGLVCLAILL